ncbi:succinate--CoA ligase subunit alpha [Desulfitibacter alkalitolerans]|uniref:succinate--CoA ligase subunit alpha n=1 Tax=Desulfitibacter alkalitolerans TaxID=264641 RepID=UPI00048560D0|nr:CoA-binding protein [Desulfitibacter alkalitolerans]
MAILLNQDTRVIIQGITGREASMVTEHILAYGTKVVGGVTPGKGGQQVQGVPVYNTVRELLENHQANTSLIYVPPRAVLDAVREAVENKIKLLVIITENVPQHDAMKLYWLAKNAGITVIGPNSVGAINPGHRVKLGAIGGDNTERCFVPGNIGVISRSGGMTAETAWMVKRAGFGVSTCISIGGDSIIGTSPVEYLKMFADDEETDAVVIFAEPGTSFEEETAEFCKNGGFKKPLIAYVAGKFTENMPEGTVFGHAASIISKGIGKPSTKMRKLKEAGAHIAESHDDIIPLLRKVMQNN